jgi:hypothetical protein
LVAIVMSPEGNSDVKPSPMPSISLMKRKIMAQSLQNQLWFVEVDWDIKPLRDSSEDVFRFMSEMEGMGEGLTSELPSGLRSENLWCSRAESFGWYSEKSASVMALEHE